MIQRLTAPPYPWDLLLLADPSKAQVENYLYDSDVYVLKVEEVTVGVYVLLQRDEQTIELMNIAVAEEVQHQGYGHQLLAHAMATVKAIGVKKLLVGTGNSSIEQLVFYQKHGFRMTHIIRDFFIEHYDTPIFENGIQCRDMIQLTYIFKDENRPH
ncbi:GNAT family N-acetyltransferase [Kurthia massiliensis]|uniref:GNAT family N-acetyltransferase n=1 Tax=Kurthia massiliensis TaxID=1033739 RepID=UPI00028A11A7|nr:GNAT family N-acetyltransferase [Kurthia massiliensis]